VAKVVRWRLGNFKGKGEFTLNDGDIKNQSVVLVSVSEGLGRSVFALPGRWVGSASIRVENIAPFEGGVVFRVVVDWDQPLTVWADIFVADEIPQGYVDTL